jgi:hypothetical protein
MKFLSGFFSSKSQESLIKSEQESLEAYAKRFEKKTGIQVKVEKEDAFDCDVYISGEKIPVMRLDDIKAGFFINDATKKVIAKPSDIAENIGEIVDARSGEVIVGLEKICLLVTKVDGKK